MPRLLSKQQMQGRLLDELWKIHFIDGNVSRSIESLLANEDHGLIRLICNKTKGVTPAEVRASLKRAKIRIDFPVLAISGATKGSIRPAGRDTRGTVGADVTIGDLIQAGLIKAPLPIERDYKTVHLTGLVRPDGRIEFGGKVYDSLSAAAGMARKSVSCAPAGRPLPPTNGWTFWQYSDDNGGLREIGQLRAAYSAQRKLKVVPMG